MTVRRVLDNQNQSTGAWVHATQGTHILLENENQHAEISCDTAKIYLHKNPETGKFDLERAELEAILAAFGAFHDEHVGLVRAEVVSVEQLAEEEIDRLAAAIGASIDKQVIVSNKVDPEMLGGVIVRYQGMVADGSLRTALKELRSEMLSPKFESELVHEN